MTLLERLSKENGWTPDVIQQNSVVHHFEGRPGKPKLSVTIYHEPGSPLALFSCSSRAKGPGSSFSRMMVLTFFARDETPFANWRLTVEDGIANPKAFYAALVGGLDANMFKVICASLVGEVAFVEEVLEKQGTL